MKYTIIFNSNKFLEKIHQDITLEVELLEFLTIGKFLKAICNRNNKITVITGSDFENVEYLDKLQVLTGLDILQYSYIQKEITRIVPGEIILFFEVISRKNSTSWGKIRRINISPLNKKKFFWFF